MGSRDRSGGSSQGNPEHRVSLAQQSNHSAERRQRGTFPSREEEVVVVETVSLRCFQCVRGREMRTSLRLNPG